VMITTASNLKMNRSRSKGGFEPRFLAEAGR
jgi:hypothetical protein